MNKKIIAALICAAFTTSPAYAYTGNILSVLQDSEQPVITEDTIITITPGGESININGTETPTEPAYITDSGVTLVPLRTISEAFGAELEWNQETQTITILYSDVTISLTVGSKAAQVNDHAEELEEAPVISGESTMVPLRFVSETFGAEVSYDEETQLITIALSADQENETLKGMHDKPYIGDSYYGWSMKTPTDFKLSSRSFDGSSIVFSFGMYSISIDVEKYDEPIDADYEYQSLIGASSNYIISECEKTDNEDGTSTIRMKYRSSYLNSAINAIIDGDTMYIVDLSFYSYADEDIDTSTMDEMYSIIDSFTNSVNEDMYDFSDIVEGMREYKDENFKLKINLPESFKRSNFSSENKILFSSESNELYGLKIEICSATDECSISNLPELEREDSLKYYNPDMASIGDIEDMTVNGVPARGFKINLKTDGASAVVTKAYFVVGSYMYIITLACGSDEESSQILDSLTAEELDEEKLGTILRVNQLMDTYTTNSSTYKITLPKYWYYDMFAFTNILTGNEMYIQTFSDQESFDEFVGDISEDDEISVISEPQWRDTENGREFSAAIMLKDDVLNSYGQLFCREIDGKYYAMVFFCPELYYSDATLDEFNSIKDSFEIVKKDN